MKQVKNRRKEKTKDRNSHLLEIWLIFNIMFINIYNGNKQEDFP